LQASVSERRRASNGGKVATVKMSLPSGADYFEENET
jgi:hypothetical protein